MRIYAIYLDIISTIFSQLLYLSIVLINKSLRITITNNSGEAIFADKNFIFAIWHRNTFVPIYLYRNKNIAMFVSKNLNGKILEKTATKIAYDTIPLSKDPAKSTVCMHKRLKNHQNVIMAVDGPTGPALKIKEGAHYLTEKTDTPTIGVQVNYSFPVKLLWRWDKYKLPVPFSKVEIIFSKPYNKNSNWDYLAHDLGE